MINDEKLTADITVSNCKAASSELSVYAPTAQIGQLAPANIRSQRTSEQLNEISERIKKEQEKITGEKTEKPEELSMKEKIAESSKEKKTVVPLQKTCPTCQQETKSLTKCSNPKCAAFICDGCGVESVKDGKTYCEKCWDSDEFS